MPDQQQTRVTKKEGGEGNFSPPEIEKKLAPKQPDQFVEQPRIKEGLELTKISETPSADQKPSEQQKADKEPSLPLKAETKELKQKIEGILDKELKKIFYNLPPEAKKKLEQDKKTTAQKIFYILSQKGAVDLQDKAQSKIKDLFTRSLNAAKDFLFAKNSQNALRHKVETKIYKLLTALPGQNKYYLRQQTKIIVDEIMNLVEGEIVF